MVDPAWIVAVMAIGVVVLNTTIQYFCFQTIVRLLDRMHMSLARMLLTVLGSLLVHAAQIICFGVLYDFAETYLHLQAFQASYIMSSGDYLFLSAEIFSALGYGNIIPAGPMRVVTVLENLSGLLMIGWSITFAMRVRQHSELLRK